MNGIRLSQSGLESEPFEIYNNDTIQFGESTEFEGRIMDAVIFQVYMHSSKNEITFVNNMHQEMESHTSIDFIKQDRVEFIKRLVDQKSPESMIKLEVAVSPNLRSSIENNDQNNNEITQQVLKDNSQCQINNTDTDQEHVDFTLIASDINEPCDHRSIEEVLGNHNYQNQDSKKDILDHALTDAPLTNDDTNVNDQADKKEISAIDNRTSTKINLNRSENPIKESEFPVCRSFSNLIYPVLPPLPQLPDHIQEELDLLWEPLEKITTPFKNVELLLSRIGNQ